MDYNTVDVHCSGKGIGHAARYVKKIVSLNLEMVKKILVRVGITEPPYRWAKIWKEARWTRITEVLIQIQTSIGNLTDQDTKSSHALGDEISTLKLHVLMNL